jgi:hypothetical protein
VQDGIQVTKDDMQLARCVGEDAEANAAFIVRAVNAHDALVSQLREHHEDAVYEDHFERVAAGDMGCTTCTLLAIAEGV